jgi:hypothetical protein
VSLPILRDDALVTTSDGFALRISLPWIRSLPIASLLDPVVELDGEQVSGLLVDLGDRRIPLEDLASDDAWWFVQDRVTLTAGRPLTDGPHEVAVSFRLLIPYLPAGPDAPLTLPFGATQTLTTDAAHIPAATTHEHVAAPDSSDPALPDGWRLSASAFNWTPEVIAAERSATDIAVSIAADGVADTIEVELGQLWRSFPEPADADVDALRDALADAGGEVSIVGASVDDWLSPTRRRDDDERLAFLVPQLRAAHRLGAQGLRLPIGQAGTSLLRRLQPMLHDLDLVLFEEVQGQQVPGSPAHAAAYDAIAELDDIRIRLLVDCSMLMPALPPSYLVELRAGGVPSDLVDLLASDWRSPDTHAAVLSLLGSGGVPPRVHTMFMNLLVRFGRSDAADLRAILPLTGGVHLKFWDLDDGDGRVSAPLRDLGRELVRSGFTGTLCSEWGGHEWLEDLAAAPTTIAHLALARAALAAGAASA